MSSTVISAVPSIVSSIRRTLRRLLREPGFTAVGILTLGLALGAVISVFSLVDGVLLRQLPYPEAERLVTIDHRAPSLGLPHMGISPKLYLHYRDNAQAFAEIALVNDVQVTITGDGSPERIEAANVTPSFFRMLGLAPALGRAFSEAEGKVGAPDVAVLSDGLWRERFGADRTILGRVLEIKGRPHEVVGVMPPGIALPEAATRLWLVRQVDEANAQLGSFGDFALARLDGGRTVEGARADLDRFMSSLVEIFPEDGTAKILDDAEFFAHLEPLLDTMVTDVRAIMWILLGTVALILTIACANVTNLFLVRVEERLNEVAVRGALGANRAQLVRSLIGETLVMAILAGAFGVVLAIASIAALRAYGPGEIPRLEEVGVDARVLAFALAVSIVSGILLGLLPALRGSRTDLVAALKEGGRSSTTGRQRHLLRNALVGMQVALGLVLLMGCGLLVRSLLELRSVDPGFRPDGALSFQLSLPSVAYPEPVDRARFADQLRERLLALPGVEQVGAGEYLPLTGQNSGSGFQIEDFPLAEGDLPSVFSTVEVGDGFFGAMGMRLLEGRWLDDSDQRSRNGNVVVTRALAERLWPDGSALGKRLQPGALEEDRWSEIVGVADHVYFEGLDKEPATAVYRPLLGPDEDDQDIDLSLTFVVRTDSDPSSLAGVLRSEVWGLDPDVPIAEVVTLDRIVERSRARLSFTVAVLMVASLTAIVIAAVGLYGVVSYLVSRRRHEIGVRMALGADQRRVSRLVLREGVIVALLGTLAGVAFSIFVMRLLDSLLYGVGRLDPVTFVTVPLVLLLVTLLASWVPAWRASRLDPLMALRHE